MKYLVFIVVFMMLARPVLPVLEYVLNYNYITTVLCENKAKPQMHCNGKCHLMKELAKASETEKPVSEKKASTLYPEVLFSAPIVVYTFKNQPLAFKAKTRFNYNNYYSSIVQSSVFRPPVSA